MELEESVCFGKSPESGKTIVGKIDISLGNKLDNKWFHHQI